MNKIILILVGCLFISLLFAAIGASIKDDCASGLYKKVESKRFTGKYWISSTDLICIHGDDNG